MQIIKEIIKENDKITTIVKIEKNESPADNKPTGTKVIQTKKSITLQML